MSNSVTSERYWSLDTASATAIKAAGTPVIVRKIVFYPNAVTDDAVIQEYDLAGSARTAIRIKARILTGDTSSVEMDFGPYGRRLNGFILVTLDGGSLDVYIGRDI